MKFNDVIGIDVGKISHDMFVYSSKQKAKVKNIQADFKAMIKKLKANKIDMNSTLFAFEHTGIYTLPLAEFLQSKELNFVIVPGLEIKRSIGIQRGKNDAIDAKRIAEYAFLRKDSLKPTVLPNSSLLGIKRLLSLRERIVKQRGSYKKTTKENAQFLSKKENKTLFKIENDVLKFLNMKIQIIEEKLLELIKNDQIMHSQFELITSIKGIGFITAINMIAFTNCFSFFDNWRKFASYAGTAPFPYQSGISINGRTKVNHLANKKFKALLNLCARSAIICNPEMKEYYKKRIEEGKNGMATLNIIRNKLLARIFAVVKRGTPYVNTMAYVS